jgi:SAM-dependent methyltransferase
VSTGDCGPRWGDLDAARDPSGLLGFLDEMAAQPAVAAGKRRSFALLAPSPGDRLLDAGCGTGADALALLPSVLPGGEVIGIDSSEVAVAAARERAGDRPRVNFIRAELTALPFPDAHFAAARADRVLLHIDRAVYAVHELLRVTRPGGRVVITEGRFTGVEWLPGRESQPGASGDVLPALPIILDHLGAIDIQVQRDDSDVTLSEDARAVVGVRDATARLSIVHIAATVGGSAVWRPA